MVVTTPLQEAVLGFRARPSLPWRVEPRDPWAVLVSEVMLSQTQVTRVATRFGPFLERFPTPAACAAAPAAEVLREWQGLGYNRRAVALHRAAGVIVEQHAGAVPSALSSLLALPGVGSYTARAVLAFGFCADAAPVDVNIRRVLLRAVAGSPLPPRRLQALADSLVPVGRSREWSEGLMDLGAMVCVSSGPRCAECPLANWCAWRAARGADPAAAGSGRRQPRFEGSDRQCRGRLVAAACAGPVPADELAEFAGCAGDPARAERLAGALVAEGLLAWSPLGSLVPAGG